MVELKQIDKERIILEERYRSEVRQQLTSAESKATKSSVITFLNSSFALWLLSALFVSGAGSLYTQWHTSHEEKQKRDEQNKVDTKRLTELHRRMQLEIAHRLSGALIRLSDVAETGNHHKIRSGHSANEVEQILEDLATGTGPKLVPLYPELANQSAVALAMELSDGSPESEQSTLKEAVSDLSGLTIMMEVEHSPASDPFRVAVALQKRLEPLKFDSDFYFLDCGTIDPFC